MDKKNTRATIIIVSFNTREMTLACLNSLFKQTHLTSFHVVVVDNASSDGSADAIAKNFPQAELIRLQKNVGFAAANNLAAKRVFDEYLLLLNPDTVVLDGAIDNLIDHASNHPNDLIWGGRTLFSDGTLNPASCWGRQTVWSLLLQACGISSIVKKSNAFNPEGIGGWERDSVRHVDIVTGCFLLINRTLWVKLNGFSSDFFMYGEEADLCLRARRYGANPSICCDASIVHYGGASDDLASRKMKRLLAAKMLLIDRHFPSTTKPLARVLLNLWPISRCVVHGLLQIWSPLAKEKHRVWRDILRARKSWSSGLFESQ